MLLRTKILVAFLTSFLIVGVILLGQNLRARTIIEKTAVLEIASAHEIIWDKILQETNRELLLYALKGEPGSSSIWALRGSRSPISAIETRKPKLIKRALGKYFEALREEGILDHILIFDNHIGEHILKQTFVRSVDGTLHEVIGQFILFIFR